MTLRQYDYGRDPLTILIERENGTCKGCMHIVIIFDRKICAKSITGKSPIWRCSAYIEKENIRIEVAQ